MSAECDALVKQMERELGPRAERTDPGKLLFHYTDAKGFLGVLADRQLWATHCRHLNDTAELLAGEDLIQREAERMAADPHRQEEDRFFFRDFARFHAEHRLSKKVDVFVACLSEDGNRLSQWRAYAANGAGFSLGFSGFRLPYGDRDDAQIALMLTQCVYDEEAFTETVRGVLTDVMRGCETYVRTHRQYAVRLEHHALNIAIRRLGALAPRYKHGSFREEQEWRLVAIPMPGREAEVVKFRAAKSGVVPYLPIDLAEDAQLPQLARVYVGPSQDPEAGVAAARVALRYSGYDGESIAVPSSIPYRA